MPVFLVHVTATHRGARRWVGDYDHGHFTSPEQATAYLRESAKKLLSPTCTDLVGLILDVDRRQVGRFSMEYVPPYHQTQRDSSSARSFASIFNDE